MRTGTARICVHGEELTLLPGRAALWQRRKTVIVADTHFGKSGFFGSHGIPVPAGSDELDRKRLSAILSESRAERLIVLGDFLHAPLIPNGTEARDLDAWSKELSSVRVIVIAGNHDKGASRPWSSIAWLDGELLEPPFCFVHEAASQHLRRRLFTVSGHVHPVMKLGSRRKPSLRVPAFWHRSTGLVLPSFGAFTGGFAVRPSRGEHLFAAGPDAVTQMI
jgi:uncharacterized protein